MRLLPITARERSLWTRSHTTPEVCIPIEIVGHGSRTIGLPTNPKLLTIVSGSDDENGTTGGGGCPQIRSKRVRPPRLKIVDLARGPIDQHHLARVEVVRNAN